MTKVEFKELVDSIDIDRFPMPIKIDRYSCTEDTVRVRISIYNQTTRSYSYTEDTIELKHSMPLDYRLYLLIEECVLTELKNCFLIRGKAIMNDRRTW